MESETVVRFGVLVFEISCSTWTVRLVGIRMEVLFMNMSLARMAG